LTNTIKESIRRLLPRTIQPHRIFSGFSRGKVIFTSWYDYPAAILGTTERELINWFVQNVKSGETWLDIGAHYGYTALALSTLTAPNGRVFAFEPMITTAGFLNLTRQANHLSQLFVIPIALGSSKQISLISLPVTRGMADSTLKQADYVENILQSSLDYLWSDLCGSDNRMHGVKIDVQGMEFEVLSGMQSILATQKPKILLEFHIGVDRSKITELLSVCGYQLPGYALPELNPIHDSQYLDNQSYLFLPNG
jgi:FkbM family methyltransferase